MLIMESTSVNFNALAENIANEFFSKGTPLTDGCVKTATDNSLTPEEVRRLVEATNRTASIHLLKTADDKKATFTLAQTGLVLSRTHPGAERELSEKTAAHAYSGLTKAASQKRDHFGEFMRAECSRGGHIDKTAAEEPSTDTDNLRAVFALRQELDAKRQEKIAFGMRVQDRIDWLASEFSVWNGPDFGKFASDCLDVLGDEAVPTLEGLASYLHEKMPSEKTASDEPIDDTTPHMDAMRDICSGLRGIVKLSYEIDELERALDFWWSGTKGGMMKTAAGFVSRASNMVERGVRKAGIAIARHPKTTIGVGLPAAYGVSQLPSNARRAVNNVDPYKPYVG